MNDNSSQHTLDSLANLAQPPAPEVSPRARALLIAVTVVVGLVVAAIPLIAGLQGSDKGHAPPLASEQITDAPTPPTKQANVQVHEPVTCPTGSGDFSPHSELAKIQLPCLTEGGELPAEKTGADVKASTSMAAAVAGKPTIVNVWAWWCGPCRTELPVMQELREKHPEYNVVGVHLDAKAQAGADMLRDLKVHNFPSFQDSSHTFDALGKLPKVVPLTVVYRGDGTRAKLIAKAFDNVDDLEKEVALALEGNPEEAR
ncbi:TlpA family protein disulfide reductase [Corynebacterium auriscanis]|uniref:TlpA family protein disulfide reductase n=1 Tax=Corynebacterium auriscanis TaxID=99807 RepID=UPI000690EBD8|nr:TlpA disulfide reductase family protein [Corynebacterium auriscanis]WJY73711.1 Thiol:disulfide interchange protein TlpA [Corynebacterium auriscanis]